MKTKLVAFLGAVLLAGVAGAAPIPLATANPYAEFGTGDSGLPPVSDPAPAYYIWANDSRRSSWSVRWSGDGDWKGAITYSNWDGFLEVTPVQDHSADTASVNILGFSGSADLISFNSFSTGSVWGGFDFSLDGLRGDFLTFHLRGSALSSDSVGVYFGQDMSPVDAYISPDGTRHLTAMAPVPEPASMLLLGTGLLGLAGYGRRKGFRKHGG